MQFIKNKLVSSLLIVSMVLVTSGVLPGLVEADSLINAKDVMSNQDVSATSDHTLTWTLASGKTNATTGKVTIDFTEADFVTSGTYATTDFQFTDNLRTNQAPIAVGTGAATCGAGGVNAYTVDVTAGTSTFVITFCTGWTASSTGVTNTFKILGTAGGGLLTNKSSDVESSLISITNSVTNTDSTVLAAVVEADGIVTVSATVNPTLTLDISSSTVALGTLTTAATGTGFHTARIATNATGGFLLTYNGTTLTASSGTIPAYGSVQSSVAGTAGFGINLVDNATPDVGATRTQTAGTCAALPADYGTVDKFSYVAGTTTSLTNQSAPADCTYTVSYVANISAITPAGSYTAPITYIASGTF